MVLNGYKHFYGQGSEPSPGRSCALHSDSRKEHANNVALGAKEGKEIMDIELPDVDLRFDPTAFPN